ncbi:hypothetical protein ACTS95_08020 [Empedobacter brevis]
MSQFRYHPVIEGLKVNEDGTEIYLDGSLLSIKVHQLKHTIKPRRIVNIGLKQVTVIRLVCDCWHGLALTGEHAARRIDESKGDHYTNLYWGKKGMNKSSAAYTNIKRRKLSEEQFFEIEKRQKTELLKDIVKDYGITEMTFYRHKKKYYGAKEEEN